MNLQNKVALVTGAGVRLGQQIALHLSRCGVTVAVHHSQSSPETTLNLIREAGGQGHAFRADFTDANAVRNLIPTVQQALGQLDILINSAAIFPQNDQWDTDDDAQWQALMAINLHAPFILAQQFAKQLPNDCQGRIVNILDARLRRPLPDHIVYRLTKQALHTLTPMLALALAPRITVNGVAPGAILPPPEQSMDYLEALARERVPLRRAGEVKMVAQAVEYLLTQPFMTGVVLPLDGGQFL